MWHLVSQDELVSPPVTLEQARAQVRLSPDMTEFDPTLQMLIDSALSHCEAYCNRAFAERDMTWGADGFADLARLPMAPCTAIGSIGYQDMAGAAQAVPEAVYELRPGIFDAAAVLRVGAVWPRHRPGSRITLAGTFGGACPPDVRHAMLLLIEEGFEPAERRPDYSARVASLLCNHRRGAW